MSQILDKFCDIVLVGDSYGKCFIWSQKYSQISLENIIQHSKSVKKGIKKSLLVVDMPKGTYKNYSSAEKML